MGSAPEGGTGDENVTHGLVVLSEATVGEVSKV